VTRILSAELLHLGGLASDIHHALVKVDQALNSGGALERFARMVRCLGGPTDLCDRPGFYLAEAPVQRPVLTTRPGWVHDMQTRDMGLLVIALGGGRHQANDVIDARVGLSAVVKRGQWVQAGDVLAVVHAADADTAARVRDRLLECIEVGDEPPTIAALMCPADPARLVNP
jgi:thymidine phosphorylase